MMITTLDPFSNRRHNRKPSNSMRNENVGFTCDARMFQESASFVAAPGWVVSECTIPRHCSRGARIGFMADSILLPVILGPAALIRSSSALSWQSLLLEKYSCNPGERPEEKPLDRHVLVMLCSPAWRGEKKAADGTFAPTSKTLGALTTVPRGPVPVGRSFQKADILYCGFDNSLLSAVREELDGPLPLPVSARS